MICGGRSAEHEVSIVSAASVLTNLDQSKFDISVIGIDKKGRTLSGTELVDGFLTDLSGLKIPDIDDWILYLRHLNPKNSVVFPVLHGPYGEDGTVQGYLELLDLPYVGAGVGGSAVGMNKLYCKSILKSHGIPVLPAVSFNREEWEEQESQVLDRINTEIGFPLFVKPANMGSSIGVHKCRDSDQLAESIKGALQYDDFIFAEKGIVAREIEVSVLGGLSARASCPGEIIPNDEFYSYEAKYLDDQSHLIIPSKLPDDITESIRQMACRVFQVLQLEGMARIDFLVEKTNDRIWVSEPNTIPGFTPISMYPKLWEASGIPYSQLLEELIELGIKRHQRRARLSVIR